MPPPNFELFDLGSLVATPAALAAIPNSEWINALVRHAKGDWGDMPPEDVAANNTALETGARLMSSYHTAAGTVFWIITEADRSVTTILLPDDY